MALNQLVSYFQLKGGEDLVSPPLVVPPGRLLFSKNYEAAADGGYSRIEGYERFDGQPKPSEATYVVLPFDTGTNEPAINDAINGSLSSETGRVAGFTLTSGDWSTNNAVGLLAVYNASGTFVDNDVLTNTTQTNTLATQDGAQLSQSAPTEILFNQWLQAAIEGRRAVITVVPGEGDILGVWGFEGSRYTFRNAVGGATAAMYRDTTAGWVLQNLGESIAYTTGATAEFVVGETITGGTSGATGVISNYTITSGSFTGGDAAGTIYFHTLASGPFQAETITGGTSTGTAAIAGASTTITLPPGGKYEFVNFNFFGDATRFEMYGVNGVGDPFSWNGSGLTLIEETGVSTIFATHIATHKNHIMFAYASSLLTSGLGEPLSYTALSGAVEFAVGDIITGLENTQGDVLSVFTANTTSLLYGTSAADWNLKEHSLNTGAREWTIQRVFNTRFLDDRGLTQLNAVFAFGDFKENTFSQEIDPLVKAKLGTEIDSVVVREKDQYRIFFSDNTALFCRIWDTDDFPQFTRVEYPIKVLTCNTTENSTGQEEIFFGSEDGFVYQMDAGTSFDGAAMEYVLRLPFNNLRSPRNIKRFYQAILEIDAPAGIDLKFAPDFQYGSSEIPKGQLQTFNVSSGGGYWNEGIQWGSFFWGGQTQGEAKAYIKGSALNMALIITGSSTYEEVHTITGVTLQYTVRGVRR